MKVTGFLASRGFAILLLILSILILFLWSRFPQFYSHWLLLVPASLVVSLTVCVARRFFSATTKDIRLWGSVVFHVGMIVIIIAAILSPLARFYAVVVLPEDVHVDVSNKDFFFEERAPFAPSSGFVYFRLNRHETKYKEGRFPVEHVAEITVGHMSERGVVAEDETIRVNEPAFIDGYQLLLARGYLVPRFVLKDEEGRVVFDAMVRLSNITSQEDTFEIPEAGLILYTRFFPDVYKKGRSYRTLSLIPRDPAFGIKVATKKDPFRDIWKGVLKVGQSATFNGMTLEFRELKPVVEVEITSDPSYYLVFAGWIMIVSGLLLRYIPAVRRRGFVR